MAYSRIAWGLARGIGVLAMGLATVACLKVASGGRTSQVRQVEDFEAVALNGSGRVNVTIGDERSVEILAREDELKHVQTEVVEGKLVLSNAAKGWNTGDFVANIVVPRLRLAELNGSGHIEAKGLDEEKFEAVLNGSGDITAEGKATRVEARCDGSGDVILRRLRAAHAAAKLNGSGNIEVYGTEEVACSLSGSGRIEVSGSPKSFSKTVTGSGSVRKL